MEAALKFDLLLSALIGEDELMEAKIEHAVEYHSSACACEECQYFRELLFGDEERNRE